MKKTCEVCGKRGKIAEDETDPGQSEMACDTRGVVAWNEWVCGECLEKAEDQAAERLALARKGDGGHQ